MAGVLGILIFVATAWAASDARHAVRWRTVGVAFAVQVGIGALVFGVPEGRVALEWLSARMTEAIGAGGAGVEFLFGPLVTEGGIGFVFALQVLPMIVFFSSLIAVLYHLQIMPWIIRIIGGGLHAALRTSRTESMSAAANIFVGQTEAPLVVRPYIPRMTSSELFAVMVGGLASVAGSVLAGYASMGVEMKYLLAASFMAAPGGLLFAKLMKPEVGVPEDGGVVVFAEGDERPVNVLDAAALGAGTGLRLALNVGAMLLAFVGLIALVNLLLGGMGAWFGRGDISLQLLLGWLFAPLAWLTGIPPGEVVQGGSLIGQKLVLNEFVAYLELAVLQDGMSEKTRAISTVALCGFANLSSIAILLGGLGVMAPARRPEIARLGLKAVAAATLANLTSAAIAGLFVA
jgi:concentrative nucleoside transporter, CNT family